MQFVKDFNNRCKVLECVSTLDFLLNSEMIISMFFRCITIVDIWNSYICTAVKKRIEEILAAKNTTELVVENMTWKKFRPVRDLNPWPPRYRCSALSTTEPTGQLEAGHYVESLIFVSSPQCIYHFHISAIIIHHLEGLFGSNIIISIYLAC